MRTLHANSKPLPRRLDFAQRHRLPIRIIVDGEMATGTEPAAIAHRLRNDHLAAAGGGSDHVSEQCLLDGLVNG